MKKNINKIKILKIFIFSFLFLFFANISVSLAACGWANRISPPPDQDEVGDSKCNGTKPANDYGYSWACFCDKQAQPAATDPNQPKIVIPDLQITIPGLDKFSEADITCTGEGSNRTCQSTFLAKYIAAIYKYALGVIGIIAVIVMMIGGVMWIVAAGSASRVTEAKAWIGASITGLILMLSSYTILSMINPDLVNFRPLSIQQTGEQEKLDMSYEKKIDSDSSTYVAPTIAPTDLASKMNQGCLNDYNQGSLSPNTVNTINELQNNNYNFKVSSCKSNHSKCSGGSGNELPDGSCTKGLSQHGEGKGIDIACGKSAAEIARCTAIAKYLYENQQRLGLRQIIYSNATQYNSRLGKNFSYQQYVLNGHYNHIHIGFN